MEFKGQHVTPQCQAYLDLCYDIFIPKVFPRSKMASGAPAVPSIFKCRRRKRGNINCLLKKFPEATTEFLLICYQPEFSHMPTTNAKEIWEM